MNVKRQVDILTVMCWCVVWYCTTPTINLCWCGVEMEWACAASRGSRRLSWCVWAFIPQVILFSFFFLGVTTMRVVFVFLCMYYYLHIACFNALSLCRFLVFLSFSFSKCVRRYLLFKNEKTWLIDWLNDELFIYFLKNNALVQNDLWLLFTVIYTALAFTLISGIKIKCGY